VRQEVQSVAEILLHSAFVRTTNCTGPPLARVPGYRSVGLGFDSRRYQIFGEVVGPLSLVSTVEELLGRKSSGSGLETRDYGHSVRSVGIVRSRTKAAEFVFV
jgi:hypothetical protein